MKDFKLCGILVCGLFVTTLHTGLVQVSSQKAIKLASRACLMEKELLISIFDIQVHFLIHHVDEIDFFLFLISIMLKSLLHFTRN